MKDQAYWNLTLAIQGCLPMNKFCVLAFLLISLSGCNMVTNVEENIAKVPQVNLGNLEISDDEIFDAFSTRRGGVTIAVSSFEDLSGSRTEGGASTSVAGSGMLLLEYLLRQHAAPTTFRVFSRKLLNELVNERRLAAQLNAAYAEQQMSSLSSNMQSLLGDSLKNTKPLVSFPEIIPVNYLVTGAVIGYDKNILDLGAGAGSLGINNRYQQSTDSVTVMVQLINVATAEIIGVGVDSETIESNLYDAGVFKLLKVDQILELEGGGSLNEPKTYALYVALDRAVKNMLRDAI